MTSLVFSLGWRWRGMACSPYASKGEMHPNTCRETGTLAACGRGPSLGPLAGPTILNFRKVFAMARPYVEVSSSLFPMNKEHRPLHLLNLVSSVHAWSFVVAVVTLFLVTLLVVIGSLPTQDWGPVTSNSSSTLVGGKGGAGGPSSLHTMLEGPTEYVNARWMQGPVQTMAKLRDKKRLDQWKCINAQSPSSRPSH